MDKINKYGNQLLTLNDQIRAIESGGIEHANDLRDARNQILDELAELTNMSFSEDQIRQRIRTDRGRGFRQGRNLL